MRAVVTITLKDLRLGLRDRSAFVIGVLAPLTLAIILNAVAGDFFDGDQAFSVDYGVVDHDGGEMADTLITVLEDDLDGLDVDVVTGLDEDDARRRVDDGDLAAVFVVPEGFTAAVTSAEAAVEAEAEAEAAVDSSNGAGSSDDDGRDSTEVQVIADVNQAIGGDIASSIATGFVDNVNASRLAVATVVADGAATSSDIDALAEQSAERDLPVAVADAPVSERQLTGLSYLIAGISVLFVFMLVGFGASGFLEEKRLGTMNRLLAAPVPRVAVPAAKAAVSVVLCLASLAILVTTSTLLMGADWGPAAAVVLLSFCLALAATSIMGLVTAVAKTTDQASQAQSVIALVMAVVGGSFFPIAQASGIIQALAVLTPHHWFLRGLGESTVTGVGGALPAAAALLLFAVVFGAISVALVPRSLAR